MNTKILVETYNKTATQRNRLLIAAGFSFLLNLLLGTSNYYLIGKERIIVAPPVISREFWVASNTVSDSYLEQMSEFFAGLLLNVTPSSFATRSEHLLQNVAPQSYAVVKALLVQQQMEIERRAMSTTFHPGSFKIDRQKLMVELKGTLKVLVGNAPIETQTKTYQIQYIQQNGRLYIQSFNEVNHG